MRALIPKKNFLRFFSLAVLVLGTSVGVILATQKEAFFDESEAAPLCGCEDNSDLNHKTCSGDRKKVLACSKINGTYRYVEESSCGADMLCKDWAKTKILAPCSAKCVQDTRPSEEPCDVIGATKCENESIKKCYPGEPVGGWVEIENCNSPTKCHQLSVYEAQCVDSTRRVGEYCQESGRFCSGYLVIQCINSKWNVSADCNLQGKRCIDRGTGLAICYGSVEKSSPTPEPVVTCKSPNYCSTRTECNSEGGTIMSGRCNYSGEVCCKF